MLKIIPQRSTSGCLTCKRRRKKCDERRPYCKRCEMGDFDCLGYTQPDVDYNGGLLGITQSTLDYQPPQAPVAQFEAGSSSTELSDTFISLPESQNETQRSLSSILLRRSNCPPNIPQAVRLGPTTFECMTIFTVSQYIRLAQEVLFRPPQFSSEMGLLRRLSQSNVTGWSMYLVARAAIDLLHGGNGEKYAGWIFRFCKRIAETCAPNEPRANLEGRLAGTYDLIALGSVVSGTMAAYSILQNSTPLYLRLVVLEPRIWVTDSSISIPEVFRISQYELSQFVIHDTITALALGTLPQLQYDTKSLWVDEAPGHYMEWIFGFPAGILIILANINAWRASRMMRKAVRSQSTCQNIERHLNDWSPATDCAEEPSNYIARLAIREAWRQTALIYLYMGMDEVNSADPRVERAVRQVVQLGNVIKASSPLEKHLIVPCLIAGVGARRERHRDALRSKIAGGLFRTVNAQVLPVRGSDFTAVLDHLWHGAGSGGRPVTWEDYVQSRCMVLPVA